MSVKNALKNKVSLIMRFFILLLLCLDLRAQQTFIELDSISHFPEVTYDSLAKYKLVLLGEMHGTKEAPVLVNSFASLFSEHPKKVIVALEIPDENQEGINKYLKTGDESILRSLRFFKDTKDGRSSVAMAYLVKSFYKKENISLFCFDISDYKNGAGYRDSMMAQNILKIKKENPEAVLITLSGNIHSNTKKGFRKGYETMGYFLKQELGSKLISLNIRYKNGTAYNCMNGECKERNLQSDDSSYKDYLRKNAYILIDKGFEPSGYNGMIYLKEVFASLPYVQF